MILKELRETKRRLLLIKYLEMLKATDYVQKLLDETEELIKIFVTSIKTAERNK
jgi:four helix bundle protein